MIRVCLWLLAGILAPQLISFPPESDLFVALLVALALALPWLRQRDLVCLLLGSAYFWLCSAAVMDTRLNEDFAGDSMLVSVRVVDFPRRNGLTTSFVATPVSDARIPPRIRLSWFEPPVSIRLGDVWRLEARLKRPRGNRNPGSGDSESWLFRERIGATGYVAAGKHNRLLDSGTAAGLNRIREHYLERLQRRLDGRQSASVMAAVVIGARHMITAEQWDRYARTGTSHLMAISGLHVGLLSAGSYFLFSALLGLCAYRGNQHRVALVVAVLLALFYAAISGFAVPAQRAALMLTIGAACLLARRELSPLRVLAAAALLIVLADPLATMAPGFKLSFAAVLLLFWLARRQRTAIAHWPLKPVFAFQGLTVIQLGLLMGLLPMTILLFSRMSLAAPIVNLVAIPLFSMLTVPLALLSLLLDGPLAGLGDLALKAAASSIDWLESLITRIAAYESGSYPVADIQGIAWLYLLLPLAWVLLPPRWPCRSAACLALIALPVWQPAGPPERCADIHMLDVGQGLSMVVQTATRLLVYDSGPSYRGGGSAAGQFLLPFLRSRGIRSVDRLVVSHSDLDHAGGTRDLVDALAVADIVSGEALPRMTQPVRPCRSGLLWEWDQVRFSVLHPHRASSPGGNDASCVLLIEAGAHRALLTGDIESGTEAELVRRRVLPFVDIVTVPHHGSRTSSTGPFVRSLMPDLALVSAAGDNQWGFPKSDVVARWQSSGAIVLNTAGSGAISVRLCAATGLGAVSEHRKRHRRIWHLEPV